MNLSCFPNLHATAAAHPNDTFGKEITNSARLSHHSAGSTTSYSSAITRNLPERGYCELLYTLCAGKTVDGFLIFDGNIGAL